MEYLLLIFPFASALASRLTRYWEVWIAWIGLATITFFGIWWITGELQFFPVIASSIFGFVAPDLWESLKALLRKPKVAGIILLVIASIFLLQHPQIMVLAIVVGGLLVILKPIIPKKEKKK